MGSLVFVPVRVRVSRRCPSRGIPFPGEYLVTSTASKLPQGKQSSKLKFIKDINIYKFQGSKRPRTLQPDISRIPKVPEVSHPVGFVDTDSVQIHDDETTEDLTLLDTSMVSAC